MHLSNVQWKRRILKLAATKSEGQRQRILGGCAGVAASGISAQAIKHSLRPHRGLQALEGMTPAPSPSRPHTLILLLFFEYLCTIFCSPSQQSGQAPALEGRQCQTVLTLGSTTSPPTYSGRGIRPTFCGVSHHDFVTVGRKSQCCPLTNTRSKAPLGANPVSDEDPEDDKAVGCLYPEGRLLRESFAGGGAGQGL